MVGEFSASYLHHRRNKNADSYALFLSSAILVQWASSFLQSSWLSKQCHFRLQGLHLINYTLKNYCCLIFMGWKVMYVCLFVAFSWINCICNVHVASLWKQSPRWVWNIFWSMSGLFSPNLIGGYALFFLLKSTFTVLFGLKSTNQSLLHLSTGSRSLVSDCATFVVPFSTIAYKEVSSAKV